MRDGLDVVFGLLEGSEDERTEEGFFRVSLKRIEDGLEGVGWK